MEPKLAVKSYTTISSSSIDGLAYVPSHSQHRRSTPMTKEHRSHDKNKDPVIVVRHSRDYAEKRNLHSLLDIDSSDDDNGGDDDGDDDDDNVSNAFPSDDRLSLHGSEPRTSTWTLRDTSLIDEQQQQQQQHDTRQATLWISNCQRGSVHQSSQFYRLCVRCSESSSILVLNPCQRSTRNIGWSNSSLLASIPSCSFSPFSSASFSLHLLH